MVSPTGQEHRRLVFFTVAAAFVLLLTGGFDFENAVHASIDAVSAPLLRAKPEYVPENGHGTFQVGGSDWTKPPTFPEGKWKYEEYIVVANTATLQHNEYISYFEKDGYITDLYVTATNRDGSPIQGTVEALWVVVKKGAWGTMAKKYFQNRISNPAVGAVMKTNSIHRVSWLFRLWGHYSHALDEIEFYERPFILATPVHIKEVISREHNEQTAKEYLEMLVPLMRVPLMRIVEWKEKHALTMFESIGFAYRTKGGDLARFIRNELLNGNGRLNDMGLLNVPQINARWHKNQDTKAAVKFFLCEPSIAQQQTAFVTSLSSTSLILTFLKDIQRLDIANAMNPSTDFKFSRTPHCEVDESMMEGLPLWRERRILQCTSVPMIPPEPFTSDYETIKSMIDGLLHQKISEADKSRIRALMAQAISRVDANNLLPEMTIPVLHDLDFHAFVVPMLRSRVGIAKTDEGIIKLWKEMPTFNKTIISTIIGHRSRESNDALLKYAAQKGEWSFAHAMFEQCLQTTLCNGASSDFIPVEEFENLFANGDATKLKWAEKILKDSAKQRWLKAVDKIIESKYDPIDKVRVVKESVRQKMSDLPSNREVLINLFNMDSVKSAEIAAEFFESDDLVRVALDDDLLQAMTAAGAGGVDLELTCSEVLKTRLNDVRHSSSNDFTTLVKSKNHPVLVKTVAIVGGWLLNDVARRGLILSILTDLIGSNKVIDIGTLVQVMNQMIKNSGYSGDVSKLVEELAGDRDNVLKQALTTKDCAVVAAMLQSHPQLITLENIISVLSDSKSEVTEEVATSLLSRYLKTTIGKDAAGWSHLATHLTSGAAKGQATPTIISAAQDFVASEITHDKYHPWFVDLLDEFPHTKFLFGFSARRIVDQQYMKCALQQRLKKFPNGEGTAVEHCFEYMKYVVWEGEDKLQAYYTEDKLQEHYTALNAKDAFRFDCMANFVRWIPLANDEALPEWLIGKSKQDAALFRLLTTSFQDRVHEWRQLLNAQKKVSRASALHVATMISTEAKDTDAAKQALAKSDLFDEFTVIDYQSWLGDKVSSVQKDILMANFFPNAKAADWIKIIQAFRKSLNNEGLKLIRDMIKKNLVVAGWRNVLIGLLKELSPNDILELQLFADDALATISATGGKDYDDVVVALASAGAGGSKIASNCRIVLENRVNFGHRSVDPKILEFVKTLSPDVRQKCLPSYFDSSNVAGHAKGETAHKMVVSVFDQEDDVDKKEIMWVEAFELRPDVPSALSNEASASIMSRAAKMKSFNAVKAFVHQDVEKVIDIVDDDLVALLEYKNTKVVEYLLEVFFYKCADANRWLALSRHIKDKAESDQTDIKDIPEKALKKQMEDSNAATEHGEFWKQLLKVDAAVFMKLFSLDNLKELVVVEDLFKDVSRLAGEMGAWNSKDEAAERCAKALKSIPKDRRITEDNQTPLFGLAGEFFDILPVEFRPLCLASFAELLKRPQSENRDDFKLLADLAMQDQDRKYAIASHILENVADEAAQGFLEADSPGHQMPILEYSADFAMLSALKRTLKHRDADASDLMTKSSQRLFKLLKIPESDTNARFSWADTSAFAHFKRAFTEVKNGQTILEHIRSDQAETRSASSKLFIWGIKSGVWKVSTDKKQPPAFLVELVQIIRGWIASFEKMRKPPQDDSEPHYQEFCDQMTELELELKSDFRDYLKLTEIDVIRRVCPNASVPEATHIEKISMFFSRTSVTKRVVLAAGIVVILVPVVLRVVGGPGRIWQAVRGMFGRRLADPALLLVEEDETDAVPAEDEEDESSSEGPSGSTIAIIVVSVVFGLAAVIAVLFFLRKRRSSAFRMEFAMQSTRDQHLKLQRK